MDNRFENVTMTGRMCYILMCIERYLLARYPDRDWSLVARKMWQCPAARNFYAPEWYEYNRIRPESIIRFKYHASAHSDPITREEYEQAVSLYSAVTDGNPQDEICRALMIPLQMVNDCDGRDYNDETGKKITLFAINEIESILHVHKIPLPDASLVAEYVPMKDEDGELDFWGFGTLGTEKLSLILNKK